MVPLAVLASLNAIVGMLLPSVDFAVFAYIDAAIKVLFGIIMLRSKKPLIHSNSTATSI
nr:DUF6609 family protein [Neobacillus terrae]